MARFYFDTTDSAGDYYDEEGLDFSSSAQARSEAQATLGGIAADEMRRGIVAPSSIRVRDSDGREVYCLTVQLFESGRKPLSNRSAA